VSGRVVARRTHGRPLVRATASHRRPGEDAMTSFFFFFLGIAVVGTALFYLKHTADNE
jgi:hypothetical protein